MINKIIVRFADGRMKKGTTEDFFTNKDSFHVRDKDNGEYSEIDVKKLKAVFFVKSFERNPQHDERDMERKGLGKKLKVKFKDGEALVGYTQGFSPDRTDFFSFPQILKATTKRHS